MISIALAVVMFTVVVLLLVLLLMSARRKLVATGDVSIVVNEDAAKALTVPAGGTLLMFTDGATEAMDAEGQLFGLERLQTALRANHAGQAQSICSEIWRVVQTFSGDRPAHDDVTLVAVKLE